MRILHVCNDFPYWLHHRAAIAEAARDRGDDVVVATAPHPLAVEALPPGLTHVCLSIDRFRANPVADLRLIAAIPTLAEAERADLVHLFTIKPLTFGGLGFARRNRRPRLIGTVAGLGRGLTAGAGGEGRGLMRAGLVAGLRFGLGRAAACVTFENPADRDFFVRHKILSEERTRLLPGAGVDLNRYRPAPERRPGPLRVLFASRLLRSKGTLVVADAARLLLPRLAGRLEVLFAGEHDPRDRDSLTDAELTSLAGLPGVRFLGRLPSEAMPGVVADADIVVLPTLYPEGLPRILLEGAACGAALVATDTPACRMIIDHGRTGLLIDAATAPLLAGALERLAADDALRVALGRRAREAVEGGGFSIGEVCTAMLALYDGRQDG
jgi:glycosyltransferase involved in cell wall biosynthesis